MRLHRIPLAAVLAVACQTGTFVPSAPPATPAPTASATTAPSATASPSPVAATSPPPPTVTPMPTPTFPPPAADQASGVGTVRQVRSRGFAADATFAVGTIPSSGVEIVTVASGSRVTVPHPRPARVGDAAIARGLVVYFDTIEGSDGAPHTFGVWRLDLTAATPVPVKLDEFPAVRGFGGGDTINPWPSPQTNGGDVVWLRAREAGGRRTHEIVAQRGIAAARVVHTGAAHPFFALGDDGRVAVVTVGSNADREALLVLVDPSGGTRELARRPVEAAGLVSWVAGKVAWFDSTFNVRPASRADLFDAATGASTPFAPPAGCGLGFPTTRRHVQVICFGGLHAVHDLVSGRAAPLAPVVVANREALMMRSTAEFNAGEQAWLHAVVLPP